MTKNGIKTRFYGNHYGYLDNHCINFFIQYSVDLIICLIFTNIKSHWSMASRETMLFLGTKES